jgi:hypothetical protein
MNFKTGLSSDGRRNVLVNLSPRFVTSREVSLPPLGIVIAGALGARSVSLKKSATRRLKTKCPSVLQRQKIRKSTVQGV